MPNNTSEETFVVTAENYAKPAGQRVQRTIVEGRPAAVRVMERDGFIVKERNRKRVASFLEGGDVDNDGLVVAMESGDRYVTIAKIDEDLR